MQAELSCPLPSDGLAQLGPHYEYEFSNRLADALRLLILLISARELDITNT